MFLTKARDHKQRISEYVGLPVVLKSLILARTFKNPEIPTAKYSLQNAKSKELYIFKRNVGFQCPPNVWFKPVKSSDPEFL